MENFDLASLERFRAPKIQNYIAVIGKTTRVMNLRIVRKHDDSATEEYSPLFQCGADILPLANGGHIIITTLGFYAFTFVEFVERYLEYERRKIEKYKSYALRHDYNPLAGLGFIFTDDSGALSTSSEDEDGNLIYEEVEPVYVENEKLLEGIKRYDSLDEFVEATAKLKQQ